MKRPSPSAPESVIAPGRRRALSEEERALWESIAKQIKPLRKKAAKISNAAAADESPITAKRVNKAPTSAPPAKLPRSAKPPPPPPLAPLGRRERSQLSRGRRDIEARLDLHGMTQTRAHRALQSFLQRASSDGLSFVLVITGKGAATPGSGRGVLRRQVPEWLNLPEFRALVVGFEEAHKAHGGEGALYVRVRRTR
ncbi:MAG TPA: Smr/MutS family protein [Bradyrhizobium sp.]|jgi:DNA-nicking Smr family endonuclease|nr:Smr/MutS family protein [Bradyrhizobium sp.]